MTIFSKLDLAPTARMATPVEIHVINIASARIQRLIPGVLANLVIPSPVSVEKVAAMLTRGGRA
jgi:hypothetical protein